MMGRRAVLLNGRTSGDMAAMSAPLPPPRRHTAAVLASMIVRRIISAGLILLAIAFLCYWGLTMAQNAAASLEQECDHQDEERQ